MNAIIIAYSLLAISYYLNLRFLLSLMSLYILELKNTSREKGIIPRTSNLLQLRYIEYAGCFLNSVMSISATWSTSKSVSEKLVISLRWPIWLEYTDEFGFRSSSIEKWSGSNWFAIIIIELLFPKFCS